MITDLDLQHLKTAIAVAARARQKGNRPFGAVLVDAQGNVLAEGENTQVTDRDCTGHAETNLLRVVGQNYSQDDLTSCTMYASTEPCPMCAGAIFWSGVGRLVYALSSDRLYATEGDSPYQLLLSCRSVLASGRRPVEVLGPAIEAEALKVFEGFWA